MGSSGDPRRRRVRFRRRSDGKQRAGSMTMVQHLDELRGRLIVSLAAFLGLSVVAFVFYDPIFEVLLRPLCSLPEDKLGPQGCKLVQLTPLEGFQVRLKLTALTGLVAASPIWLYQLWSFIVPGLTSKERRYALPFVFSSVILFAVGATVAYVMLPAGLRLLIGFGGEALVPFLKADSYINFIGLMIIAFGVMFELPLLLFFLGLVGVITPDQMRRYRKHALVGIVFLSAIVTPSQDPYTMLALSVPLYLLFELTVLLLTFVTRRRARTESL